MPDTKLKEKLINKLKEIDDPAMLEEVANLFELQEPETIYQVNSSQQKAIDEAREQIKNKQTLPGKQAISQPSLTARPCVWSGLCSNNNVTHSTANPTLPLTNPVRLAYKVKDSKTITAVRVFNR